MTHADILELAQAIAGRLGIRMKDPALVLSNMKPKTGITTILWNEGYTLWIDKHYIAYSDNFKPEIIYVFADAEHVSEELRPVIGRMRTEKSPYTLKTLTSVKEQLQLAGAEMSKSSNGLYFFGELSPVGTEETEMEKKSDVMPLCPKCKRDYENTGGYYIRRTYTETDGMEKCTKCPKDGWEYEITPKERRDRR